MTSDARLRVNAIQAGLDTGTVGKRLSYHDHVHSTNDLARELAENGEQEGTVVFADFQSAGRGRMGRTWVVPARSSLLMSIIFRPSTQQAQIGMAVGLGACKGIAQATRLVPELKWPNDILLRGKKCAGILVEAKTVGDQFEYVIAGLGVNVNFAASLVSGLAPDATTLADELGEFIPREPLAQAILRGIDGYYVRCNSGHDLRAEWRGRLSTIGQRMRAAGEVTEEGIAIDVDAEGALLLKRDDGSVARLIAGDVTLSKT